jgi:hypothetical protein
MKQNAINTFIAKQGLLPKKEEEEKNEPKEEPTKDLTFE